MKATGYSINILPSGNEYNKFNELIKKLAQEYKTLVFDPHITILGQASDNESTAIKLTEELVTGISPFSITLNKIGYQDYYFRALYVLVEKTEPLLKLHEKAKQLFGKQDIPPYIPHLSLLYGDFPVAIKEKIMQEIGREQLSTFEVKSLHVFKTEGEADSWYSVKEIPFRTF